MPIGVVGEAVATRVEVKGLPVPPPGGTVTEFGAVHVGSGAPGPVTVQVKITVSVKPLTGEIKTVAKELTEVPFTGLIDPGLNGVWMS